MTKQLLILCLLVAFGIQLQGQVVTVKERKSDDELIDVTKPFFVDINSMLSIEIDKDSLLFEMAGVIGAQTYPRELLNLVNYTIRQQQQLLSNIMATGDRESRIKALDGFRTGMTPLFTYLATNQSALDGTQFYKALNAALGTPNNYGAFFAALNAQYKQVTDDYALKVSQSSANFKLAGWLNTSDGPRQFHIPGFDSLVAGDIVEKSRFVTSIPPAEAKAYNEARDLADSINTNIDGFLSTVKSGVDSQISEVESKLTIILQGGFTTMENDINNLTESVKNKFTGPVSSLKQGLNDLKVGVANFINDVENATLSTSTMATLADDAQGLYTKTMTVEALGDSIFQLFKTEVESVPSIASQLKTNLTNDITTVVNQLKDLGQPYLEEVQQLLSILQENRVADLKETAVSFSTSTFALTYDKVPSSADVDLRTVGADREPGDQIYFKAVVERDAKSGAFSKTVFWRKYTMYHMGIHNSIRAAIVFLDKVNGDFSNTSSDFQLAPSYSAIFKIGTRHGKFYNQYLTPGLGVNVATMDFDNDNNPEIGIGVTTAFFHDYLQIGYGRNMSTDDNYWMFGLRLPLFGWATANVQGTPSKTPPLSN